MEGSPVVRHGRSLLILGTRGVPAAHGGFETFAERLALHLVAKGWQVTVYCQANSMENKRTPVHIDYWENVRRVIVPSSVPGPLGSVIFDLSCVRHATKEPGLPLILGYNTALFSLALRLRRRPVVMNMDGIEWKRAKWGMLAKGWLLINELAGVALSSVLIADHPAIAKHLATRGQTRNIVTIPYGADSISDAPDAAVRAFGLTPRRYFLMIGRIEPENQVFEIVSAYARRRREYALVCLGNLSPITNTYHAAVLKAAEGRVLFPGAIYDRGSVQALRFHAAAYCHGHSVGGTNPSLVEALGAGSPIIAHDNIYNRWVAGEGQQYFQDVASCAAALDRAEADPDLLTRCRMYARHRFRETFTWPAVLGAYEELLDPWAQIDRR